MKAQVFLFAWFITSAASGRVVLLTTDNPKDKRVAALTAESARDLDRATDLALVERADPDPCRPGPKGPSKPFARAASELPRSVEAPAAGVDLKAWLERARVGEDVTLYAVSWDRRLELRGMSTTPIPTRANLPRWVGKEFPRAAAAILRRTADEGAAVLYADLADGILDRARWETLGVHFPKEAALSAVPFLTRVDFRRPRRSEPLTFASKNTLPRVHPELVVRIPFTGKARCPEAVAWQRGEPERVRAESFVLHELTGWPLQFVLSRVGIHLPTSHIETVQP